MTDFWRSSGFHLLTRDSDGRLVVTDDFLRAYFRRPEMRPTDESCADEIALHDELMADPRRPVPPDRLARLADADARENYGVVLAFRDLLVRAGEGDGPLIDAIHEAIGRKPKGHDFVIDRRHNRPAVSRHMSVTGG